MLKDRVAILRDKELIVDILKAKLQDINQDSNKIFLQAKPDHKHQASKVKLATDMEEIVELIGDNSQKKNDNTLPLF